MAVNFKFIVLCWLVFSTTTISVSAQEDDDEDAASRTFRLDRGERPCQYRRQEGVCKRRSECARPTRHVCRFGLNPVVCCLDRVQTTTTTTTRRPPTRTVRPRPPPTVPKDDVDEINLTFPRCGQRAPKSVESLDRSARPAAPRGLGGLLRRRLGKRQADHSPPYKRVKRFDVIRPVVVGGRDAKANSWPWMVAIFRTSAPSGGASKRFLCGASLVSRNYVVSAAHCFDGEKGKIDPSKFTVVVGSHTTKDGTEYPVESVLLHPQYNQKQYYNDLSLLKVSGPVRLTDKTHPVCLPSDGLRDKIRRGENDVTVTGWGDTTFGGVSSKVLQEVSMPIVPLKDCNASYWKVARSNFPKGITNVFICAGLEEGGKDACQGDSGGPMVAKLTDNSWVQLGVVSFGYGCARPGFPGVYTRLSEYTKWFYENTDLGRS